MKQVHIRVPDDIIDMIEATIEGKSTSEKVTNFLCSNYIMREFLIMEKKKCLVKMEQMDHYLEKNPFQDLSALSEKERAFFEETLSLLESDPGKKENPQYLRSRKNLYAATFQKPVTFREFELLLYKFKAGVTTG